MGPDQGRLALAGLALQVPAQALFAAIETLSRKRADNAKRVLTTVGLLIRAIGCERIERICDGDDARQQRNLIGFEAVRVPAPVQRLVMQFDAGNHFFQLRHRTKYVGPFRRVRFHNVEFFGRERARFFQNPVLDSDFAHIM